MIRKPFNAEAALFFIGVGKSSKTYDLDFINQCYKDMNVNAEYNERYIPPIICE